MFIITFFLNFEQNALFSGCKLWMGIGYIQVIYLVFLIKEHKYTYKIIFVYFLCCIYMHF